MLQGRCRESPGSQPGWRDQACRTPVPHLALGEGIQGPNSSSRPFHDHTDPEVCSLGLYNLSMSLLLAGSWAQSVLTQPLLGPEALARGSPSPVLEESLYW